MSLTLEMMKSLPEDKQKDLFEALDSVRRKGKKTNYTATYGASPNTIARAANVPEEVGNRLHAAYWKSNWSITAIADSCIIKLSRGEKWLWNPMARLWIHLRSDKDKFSALNQSTATYIFDRWVENIIERRPQLTAQFHDEVVLELKVGNREAMTKILKDSIEIVGKELKLDVELGCDVQFGVDYSEVH